MNSKAVKQKIEFPPQLNLSNDRPHVDNSFQNWERINTPLLNDMLQPVWVKSNDREIIYDKSGLGYYIDDNSNLVDTEGNLLIEDVNDEHFEKEELKDFRSYLAYDLFNGEEYYLKKVGRKYYTPDGELEITGTIVSCRIKYLNNNPILVLYTDYNNTEYVSVYLNNVQKYKTQAIWYTQTTGLSLTTLSLKDVSPCINMAYSNGYYCISLTSTSGTVIDSNHFGFITILSADLTTWNYLGNGTNLTFGTATTTSNSIKDSLLVSFTYSSSSQTNTTRTVIRSQNYDLSSVWPVRKNAYYYNSSATGISSCSMVSTNLVNLSLSLDNALVGTQKLTWDAAGTAQIDTFNVYSLVEEQRQCQLRISGSPNHRYKINSATIQLYPADSYYRDCEGVDGTFINSSDGTNYVLSSGMGIGNTSCKLYYYNYRKVQQVRLPRPTSNISVSCWDDATDTLLYTVDVPLTIVNNVAPYDVTYNISSSQNSALIVPCIVLDDGSWHPVFKFSTQTATTAGNTSNWLNAYKKGGLVYLYGTNPTVVGSRFLTTNSVSVNTNSEGCNIFRSNSFIVNQNFYAITCKTCNSNCTTPAALAGGTTEASGSKFVEWTYSNQTGLRYFPGTTRMSSYNYYAEAAYGDPTLGGASEDLALFTVGGYRVHLSNSRFNILYNIYASGYGYINGLSYSSAANTMGTLLTPWQSIEEHSYITADGDTLIYKDKSGRWLKITIKSGVKLFTLLEDRLIILNTTSYLNCIDSENSKLFHYASDYNGRLFHGETTFSGAISGVIKTSSTQYSPYNYIRYTANAINPLFRVMPRDVVTSIILPITARYRCKVGNEVAVNSLTDEANQGIDIFYSDQNSTNCKYQATIMPGQAVNKYVKASLEELYYPGSSSSSASLAPSIFAQFINGAGNNDMILEGYDSYVLTYYDSKPTLVYSYSTQVSNLYDSNSAFFVIQGMHYGVIGNKLYSLVYSSGAISSMDAIIDLGDMVFIGNNPLIAFFYDPATRVIRGFQGDANLSTIYNATKIKEYNGYWYDETTQTIFIATNAGLLALGPRNNYLYEDWIDVSNCQFTNDGVTHITNSGTSIDLKYYEDSGYKVLPADLETSFYGLGNTEATSIDKWQITLYDMEGNHPESYITLSVRTLTDVATNIEEKTFKITPDMYDKWSNSVLINYTPGLIKGQGIRLSIKTPLAIQSIIAHISDANSGTLSRRNV